MQTDLFHIMHKHIVLNSSLDIAVVLLFELLELTVRKICLHGKSLYYCPIFTHLKQGDKF